MNKHKDIHKLVHAIKALNEAEHAIDNAMALDNIRWAKLIIWQVGEDLGVDIADQLKQMNELN